MARTPRSASQPQELVRVEPRAADVDEHDVRLDLGRLDLEARDLAEQRAELARPPVVVGEPLDERVECDERRGGRDARLVHARPAEPAQRACASSITCVRPARIAPIGAQSPLFRLTATVFTGAASSDTGTPSATAALKSRAPSRWT